jgi:hypothetical protein
LNKEEYAENRGWQTNRQRKYTEEVVAQRICGLKRDRISRKRYFVGSQYVQMDYAKQYPEEEIPSTWFIDKTVRQAGLQTKQPKKRKPGGSEYLLYPVQAIRNLGYVHQSADFIGKKYIAGHREPINIFSTSYYAPFKLYQIAPVASEKAVDAIYQLSTLWRQYPVPDVLRMDNGLQMNLLAASCEVSQGNLV